MALAAVVQMNATSDTEANWQQARTLVVQAAERGAQLVATPENTSFLGPHEDKVRQAETLEGRTCTRFSDLARELGIHLLLGSFNEKSEEPGKCFNTSVLFGSDGSRLAVYRKIHLFDVDVSPEVRFSESATVQGGTELVAVKTDFGVIGMTVCYDVRFPGLYQRLRDLGSEILTVPSAFTSTTGKDHWHPLLRARAIETQCYVLAPAQYGRHDDDGLRESYGHAMIVDPWGQIVAMAADGPGVAVAEIDRGRLQRVRASMPVSEHRKF
jgi:predicted amidohydrolase